MLGFTPPYHSLQEMNLDWLLTKIKNMLRFLPDDGTVGQILRRTAHGAEWSDEQGGGGAVNSVNGQTGTVVLDAADVGALPDTTVIPDSTSDLVNDSGFITAAGAPVQSVNSQTGTVVLGKSDIGLGNVDNVQQYSASNPPPYPVTSVNGQTGAVTVAEFLPSTVTVPTVAGTSRYYVPYPTGYTRTNCLVFNKGTAYGYDYTNILTVAMDTTQVILDVNDAAFQGSPATLYFVKIA